jgi:hypothetical protein
VHVSVRLLGKYGSSAGSIPLAKPQTSDDKEREKKKNQRKNGEGAPRGEE